MRLLPFSSPRISPTSRRSFSNLPPAARPCLSSSSARPTPPVFLFSPLISLSLPFPSLPNPPSSAPPGQRRCAPSPAAPPCRHRPRLLLRALHAGAFQDHSPRGRAAAAGKLRQRGIPASAAVVPGAGREQPQGEARCPRRGQARRGAPWGPRLRRRLRRCWLLVGAPLAASRAASRLGNFACAAHHRVVAATHQRNKAVVAHGTTASSVAIGFSNPLGLFPVAADMMVVVIRVGSFPSPPSMEKTGNNATSTSLSAAPSCLSILPGKNIDTSIEFETR